MRDATKEQQIDLNVPDNPRFFYECLIDIARDCWEKAYLLSKRGNPTEIQKKGHKVKQLINESMLKTVRRHVPGTIVI